MRSRWTWADVHGRLRRRRRTAAAGSERPVAGLPVRLPSLDVHTVGAGGGSLVWRDPGGALRVGPQSAGASPGPACYGRGGTQATVTDANLLLGRLPERLAADWSSIATLLRARSRASSPSDVVAVVDAELLRALRLVSVERGVDPRGLTLVAFGGAGPLHACGLAEELELERVLVPAAAGVLSALGLVVADERRDRVEAHVVPLDGAATLPVEGEADLRYAGRPSS